MVKFELIRHVAVPFDTKSTNFMKLEFSHDDVYLAALSGDPDYIMFYYNTQKSKIESHVEAIRLPEAVGPVTDVSHINSWLSRNVNLLPSSANIFRG